MTDHAPPSPIADAEREMAEWQAAAARILGPSFVAADLPARLLHRAAELRKTIDHAKENDSGWCDTAPLTRWEQEEADLIAASDLLRAQADAGFSYEDTARPHAFLQWKGTDACFDFYCECGAECHFDGYFAYQVRCPHCQALYQMPFNLFPRRIENQITPMAGPVTLDPDEDFLDEDGNPAPLPPPPEVTK